VQHRQMWGLPGVARVFEWFEALFSLVAGPLIVVSGLAAPFSLFTHIQVLEQPWLLAIWAIAMAAGIDIWLLVASDYWMEALIHRRWPLLGVWSVLMLALASVGLQANWVVMYGSAQGIGNDAAMARIGISPEVWALERAALVPFLVIVSTLIRRFVASRAELSVPAPATQNAQAAQVEMTRPPVGPGTPGQALSKAAPKQGQAAIHLIAAPSRPDPNRRRAPGPSVEPKARAVWRSGMSIPELEERAGISRYSAQKYHAKFTAEEAGRAQERAI
jgi:hypothetical protein